MTEDVAYRAGVRVRRGFHGDDAVFVASDKTSSARALLPHVTAVPVDDPLVRRAVLAAIDCDALRNQ